MKLIHLASVSILVLTAAVAALAVPPAASAATIAFASDRDGDYEIYAIRSDGTRLRSLTHNRSFDSQPAWSPDGRRVAFVSDRDGDEELYVMRADGSRVRQLTRNEGAADELPAWSPDGSELAYISTARGGQFDVFVIRADGKARRRLTWSPALDFAPAWSPDGERIAFASNRAGEGNVEIFSKRPDGSDLRRLTNTGGDFEMPADDSFPAWSRDAATILFSSNREGPEDLWTMAPDGSGQAPLVRSPDSDEFQASYSPAGRRIAYTFLTFPRQQEVWIADADGGNARRLTRGSFASWRPPLD